MTLSSIKNNLWLYIIQPNDSLSLKLTEIKIKEILTRELIDTTSSYKLKILHYYLCFKSGEATLLALKNSCQ